MIGRDTGSAQPNEGENPLQGRYRITRCLGSGGMGDVYLADDLRLGRLVAVKSLKQEYCKMPEVRKRIERECVMHAQLGAHPNVITLYDRVEVDGQIHLIIEYVNGVTLKDVIEKARLGSICLTWRESVSIACQILEALARIHAQGIVHRDVKPANIMLTQSDTGAYTAKLMDFGIARLMNPLDGATMLTREGGAGPGTPIYMSPEQIAGTQFGPLSPASDVYAMGVVLYQMLAKRPPFQGTITDIFHGHLNSPPPPIDAGLDSTYPPQLSEVVHKSLAKQPVNRYESAIEFRRALRRLTRAQGAVTTLAVANTLPVAEPANPAVPLLPVLAPTAEPVTTSWMFQRRLDGANGPTRTVVAIACVVVAVAAVLLGNFYFFRSFTTSPGASAPPQQSATGVVPASPVSLQGPNLALPQQSEATGNAVPAQTPAQPTAPEQPAPVTMSAAPQPAVESEAHASTATKKEANSAKQDEPPSAPSQVGPPDQTPTPTVVQQRTLPKEDPQRTPIPRQTPAPPDLTPPTHESESFAERARRPAQEMTPTPIPRTPVPQSDANIFRDVQVHKQPAIKLN